MNQLANLSTYRTGILQARAYRNLRHFMARELRDYGLSSSEWSLLGIINEESISGGIRVTDLSQLLDVEVSFVTNMVKRLIKDGYATQAYDEDDGRVRLIVGTDKASQLVGEIETKMRALMREWLADVDPQDLLTYIAVLQKLSHKTAD